MLDSLLELKLSDILGPAVAAASALVAVSSVLVNARWKEREHSTAARDDFQRTVEALVDLRQERERVRRELGDNWGLSRYATTRVALNEKRELLIAKARLERELILARTGEGRKRAQAAGVKMGRKPKLTVFQQREGRQRMAAGESPRVICRSYGVHRSTIERLEKGAAA